MKKDLVGQKFGRLKVVSHHSFNSAWCTTMWNCLCECGNTTVASSKHLRRGAKSSCGCLKKELLSQKRAKHKMTNSEEYKIWQGMKRRCYKPNYKGYSLYGGRGIIICERWLNSFENFFKDMGQRPTKIHSIDRYPNKDGNYEPTNCRWATPTEQARNIRSNVLITIDGETKCATEWSEKSNIPAELIMSRKRKGWSDRNSVFLPKQQ